MKKNAFLPIISHLKKYSTSANSRSSEQQQNSILRNNITETHSLHTKLKTFSSKIAFREANQMKKINFFNYFSLKKILK